MDTALVSLTSYRIFNLIFKESNIFVFGLFIESERMRKIKCCTIRLLIILFYHYTYSLKICMMLFKLLPINSIDVWAKFDDDKTSIIWYRCSQCLCNGGWRSCDFKGMNNCQFRSSSTMAYNGPILMCHQFMGLTNDKNRVYVE